MFVVEGVNSPNSKSREIIAEGEDKELQISNKQLK